MSLCGRAAGALRRGLRRPVHHVSLGAHCHMAQILKALRLRAWSGPFDWIFSAPGMVRDCLADDFALLLDRAELATVPLSERQAPDVNRCRHRTFGARYAIPFIFNHHDPAAVEADYRFVADGVARLRAALADEGENRFSMMVAGDPDLPLLGEVCDILAHKPARSRLTVYAIVPDQDRQAVAEIETGRPDLRVLRVSTRSASLGVRFAQPEDDVFLTDLVRADAERTLTAT